MSGFDKSSLLAHPRPLDCNRRTNGDSSEVHSRRLMIESAEIKNFRCFEKLDVTDCRRINVIVGDNGSGKTALLEAIFLALGGSPELGIRFRQQRGLEGNFAGSPRIVDRALFGDLFLNSNLDKRIEINLRGSGPEARSVCVWRGGPSAFIADPTLSSGIISVNDPGASPALGMNFVWTNSLGRPYSISVAVSSNSALALQSTGEDLDDFFYFSAHSNINALDVAARFSDLSKSNKHHRFVKTFSQTFDFIEDLSVEVSGASPVLHAKIKDQIGKTPVANVSGAVNRLIGVLICLASTRGSVVLIDELENGMYYKHHEAMWRALLSFAREYNSQIFTTTHSEEWLEALINAAGNEVDDIALWRMERSKAGPILKQFSGHAFKAGLESGGEVR